MESGPADVTAGMQERSRRLIETKGKDVIEGISFGLGGGERLGMVVQGGK